MNKVKPLPIVDGEKTIFSEKTFFIPLYQRAFAWGETEIHQLISDIFDFEADKYFLGSLIVYKREDESYEVIDGQQRLTTLFLLLHYLGYYLKNDSLVYECRIKSNYTLNHLGDLFGKNSTQQFDADKIEEAFKRGIKDIDSKFLDSRINKETFKDRLKKVQLFCIEVPLHTDLNRYFEVMNVRGEQLEQHDIVKAMLMKPFENDYAKHNAFAKIWDACRNMSGYVQMNFSTKPNDREALFGCDWSELNLDDFITKLNSNNDRSNSHYDEKANGLTALEIINGPEFVPPHDGENEDAKQVRFDSIIDFSYFLLHVLRVFTGNDPDNASIPLDDKKLVKTFKNEMEKRGDKAQFSLDFIQYLLKCRFLFDKYVIKREREYQGDDKNGVWSLKEIHNYRGKAQPIITKFGGDAEPIGAEAQKNILMLQACLRVSETSPKSMNWITEALIWLYNNGCLHDSAEFESVIEKYIQNKVCGDYLAGKNYILGIATPHLVLNYLDYLLWKDRDNQRYQDLHFDDFTFEFRNSVEHWYPRHPSDFDPWEDIDEETKCPMRDRFGNLCLVTREVNSKFSNAPPKAKMSFDKIINKGSLKLRLMSESTNTNEEWKKEGGNCAEHEKEMLNLLSSACNISHN